MGYVRSLALWGFLIGGTARGQISAADATRGHGETTNGAASAWLVPEGMVLIPEGPFEMGDTFGEGYADECPVHAVKVSAFCMDRCEVSKALWDKVCAWAVTNGYEFSGPGAGKAPNHPVHSVDWYDCVKWCNARSEMEGRPPAYYTRSLARRFGPGSPFEPAVLRTGRTAILQDEYVSWRTGYRLPTEAEWEKAARGGAKGRRFAWANGDTIDHDRADYRSMSSCSNDVSLTREFHPTYAAGEYPYTCPVDAFPPNEYGLYNMAGNVWEWCWDWHADNDYARSWPSDPRGYIGSKDDDNLRSGRGGSWYGSGDACRVAYRGFMRPRMKADFIGFRTILPAPASAEGGAR